MAEHQEKQPGKRARAKKAPSGSDPPPPTVSPEHPAPNGKNGAAENPTEGDGAKNKLDRDLVKWTRAVAVLTGALVGVALLQFIAALLQWNAMQGQLQAMIGAAPDTKKIVQANEDMAAGIKLQAGNTGSLVTQASKSANAAQRSATAASGQLAQMQEDERPRVAIEGAGPITGLVITNYGAFITVQFHLKNTGRSVGDYTYPYGMITLASQDKAAVLKFHAEFCGKVRRRKEIDVGGPIFPGIPLTENSRMIMPATDVARWKKDYTGLAPIIVGCVDYVFRGEHHQTPFLFEIDKTASGPNPFAAIDPNQGDVPKEQVSLATNPSLGARAD